MNKRMRIFLLTVLAALMLAGPASAMLGDGNSGTRPPCGWTTFGDHAGGQTCTWDPTNGFYWS